MIVPTPPCTDKSNRNASHRTEPKRSSHPRADDIWYAPEISSFLVLTAYPRRCSLLPGPDKSAGARITEFDEYTRFLDYFQAQGYNEIDTARIYVGGAQEAWTRDAKWKERGLTLATKIYPSEPGMHKRDRLKETANKSLSELGTDCVDIYYLHAPDHSVPFEETLEAVNELHKQGKFVQLGLSNFAAWEVAEVCWFSSCDAYCLFSTRCGRFVRRGDG